jgi:4a-hydroxytetrahydrobiopterin dehydratase
MRTGGSRMTRPEKLPEDAITTWLGEHPGWTRDGIALVRTCKFADYPSTIAFVTRLAFAAEKRDHHPDLGVHWGKVEVRWSTHDAGGITALDLELAGRTDELSAG